MSELMLAVVSRVIGAIVAGGATWAASKFGIVVSDHDKAQLTTAGVTIIMVVFTSVYAATHKTIEAKVPLGKPSTKEDPNGGSK